jgi:glycosyltransferase involved in cell wall biosynthesis
MLNVLHITTHDEECGIGKYQEQFLKAMKPIKGVKNSIFPYSPNKTKVMTKEEFAPVLKQFAKQLKDHDILHIQHEFSFYSKDELAEFVSEAKRQGKKVIITVHTSLRAGLPEPDVKQLVRKPRTFLGKRRLKRYLIGVHVKPLQKADLVLVHNSVTADSLAHYGVRPARIQKITMPVPELDFSLKAKDVTKHLHRKPGDVIFCTVGFLSEYKGIRDAIEALRLLAPNYKLAMIGGAHPSGANDAFCREMQERIEDLGLEKRAYISGYIKNDAILNAMIRECDLCIYPFEKDYYSGVTSASLNNSLGNYKPAVTYPTKPILEMNAQMPAVVTCKSFQYTDLAHEIQTLDIEKQITVATKYAHRFAYSKQAAKLVTIYEKTLT